MIVFSADNGAISVRQTLCSRMTGGPEYFGGDAGANNYPLKGGKVSLNVLLGAKHSSFLTGKEESGSTAGPLVATCPALCVGLRTRSSVVPLLQLTIGQGLIAAWDWYGTFAALAGVDPTDHRAAQANLPPVDSHNVW